MGGGGGNSSLFSNPTGTPMQPSTMPGYVPPAPVMSPPPMQPPNLGTPPPPMPSLAAGVTLPPQPRTAATSGDRMIALGKALQAIGGRQGQQQPQRGQPVNFNTPYQPYVPAPTPTGNGG